MDHLTLEQLLDYAEERLKPEEAQDVATHLDACPACRADLASLQQVTSILAEDKWITPPHSARAAAQQAFRQRTAPRTAPRSPWAIFGDWIRGLARPRWQPALALALLFIVAAALFIVSDEPDTVYAASATAVTGTVEVQATDSTSWRPVSEGNTLQAGDTIRTGSDGMLSLAFPDGSSSSLAANSMLALGTLQETPRTITLALQSGESITRVQPSGGDGARFEITTPTATITSPGGEFRLIIDVLETTFLSVQEGNLTVSSAGRALALGAGQEAVVMTDQPPRLLTIDPTPTPTPTLTDQPEATVTPTPTETATPPPVPQGEDDDLSNDGGGASSIDGDNGDDGPDDNDDGNDDDGSMGDGDGGRDDNDDNSGGGDDDGDHDDDGDDDDDHDDSGDDDDGGDDDDDGGDDDDDGGDDDDDDDGDDDDDDDDGGGDDNDDDGGDDDDDDDNGGN